jgi:pimeloyl-ACP methyl ester carboxylesterase
LSVFPVIAGLVEGFGFEQARRNFEQTVFYEELRKKYPASAESLLGLFDNQSSEAVVASFRAIPASAPVDSLDRLRTLKAPSLVLANRNDPIHPFELAKVLADKLPGSCFHEFPSKSESVAAHYHEFRRLVIDFLGG